MMIDQIIQDIRTQGWSYQQKVVDNSALRAINKLFDGDFQEARVGKGQERQRVQEIRGDSICWIDSLNPPAELKAQMQFLEELKSRLNQEFFLGLKEFECHLAKYPPGSFYKKHSDRHSKDSTRVLSFIFYLHEEWNEKDGGELVLYHQDNEVLKTIIPIPGSMICFLSGDFPHEVKLCHRERRSLTGWMHTKIIN